ncbi:MAG: hypothetical protein PVF97_11400 [Desulfobacterales bacterium]
MAGARRLGLERNPIGICWWIYGQSITDNRSTHKFVAAITAGRN